MLDCDDSVLEVELPSLVWLDEVESEEAYVIWVLPELLWPASCVTVSADVNFELVEVECDIVVACDCISLVD